jgi:addiction module HigA family antidote
MTIQIIPPMPGLILRHKILKRMGIKQAELAEAMDVSKVRINQILNGRAPITPNMALRLGRVTNTAPEYWLGLQRDFDLHQARHRLASVLEKLPILPGRASD